MKNAQFFSKERAFFVASENLQILRDMRFTIMTSTSAAYEDSPAFVENEELAGTVGEQDDYLGAICRCDIRHIPATGHESPPFPIEFGP
ncbi:hypothetical protein AN963_25380 [Brevibacillus choshinensis]|uniref:Uncharacterized protein n=1 Tax=Brevibacillus choshinensis TaxID=54911 RepID=A0ABR5N2H2_BRECH|nr:hypothetical protein AN963_25380 [Brevibacillus choshinensis]